MSSEEDDYLSDAFLVGCVKEDVRPGLIFNKSAKRLHELAKKKSKSDEVNKNAFKPTHVVEKEKRMVALEQPIPEDNKGFKMLQKLGFKPGSGLGKSSEGCKEPVPINVKTDRQGLGRAEEIKKVMNEKIARHREMMKKMENVDDYRIRLAKEAADRRAEVDLKKSRRICKQLDLEEGIEPDEYWFWPFTEEDYEETENTDETVESEDKIDGDEHTKIKNRLEEDDNDDDDDDVDDNGHGDDKEVDYEGDKYTVTEKLEMLTSYLRSKHHYCIWCGTKYSDEDDMKEECPGSTYEQH